MSRVIAALIDILVIPSLEYDLDRLILTIIGAIILIVLLVRLIRSAFNHTDYTIPQQLVDLIQQAHKNQPFQTRWNIQVSDDMHTALRQPLTRQQLISLSEAAHDITGYEVSCYLVSHRKKLRELSAVVNVSIHITSRSGSCDFHCSGTKLQLTASFMPDSRVWELTSVEQM